MRRQFQFSNSLGHEGQTKRNVLRRISRGCTPPPCVWVLSDSGSLFPDPHQHRPRLDCLMRLSGARASTPIAIPLRLGLRVWGFRFIVFHGYPLKYNLCGSLSPGARAWNPEIRRHIKNTFNTLKPSGYKKKNILRPPLHKAL